MLIATHTIVGAAIGDKFIYPPLAFLFGFISHFLLDALPHSDGPDDVKGRVGPNSTRQYLVVAIDGLVAVIAIIYFGSRADNSGIYWGALGGITPDLIDNVPFWSGWIRKIKGFDKFHLFHDKIQSIKISVIQGIILQYIIIYVVLLHLLRIF